MPSWKIPGSFFPTLDLPFLKPFSALDLENASFGDSNTNEDNVIIPS